jgi:O-antigen ligase
MSVLDIALVAGLLGLGLIALVSLCSWRRGYEAGRKAARCACAPCVEPRARAVLDRADRAMSGDLDALTAGFPYVFDKASKKEPSR